MKIKNLLLSFFVFALFFIANISVSAQQNSQTFAETIGFLQDFIGINGIGISSYEKYDFDNYRFTQVNECNVKITHEYKLTAESGVHNNVFSFSLADLDSSDLKPTNVSEIQKVDGTILYRSSIQLTVRNFERLITTQQFYKDIIQNRSDAYTFVFEIRDVSSVGENQRLVIKALKRGIELCSNKTSAP